MNKTNPSHVFLLIVLIIIAIGILVYSFVNKKGISTQGEINTSTTAPKSDSAVTTEPVKVQKVVSESDLKLKADILKRVSINTVLTPKERTDIFNAISGANINKYNFTVEEQKLIINAINR